MFTDDRPAGRADVDSGRARKTRLRPADRHARRLGVLGYAECWREPATLLKPPPARAGLALSGAAQIVVPVKAARCPELTGAAGLLKFRLPPPALPLRSFR
jgi:hypothetical protein